MTRERAVKEKRALKQEKKEAKKRAAAAEQSTEALESPFSTPSVEDDTSGEPALPAAAEEREPA